MGLFRRRDRVDEAEVDEAELDEAELAARRADEAELDADGGYPTDGPGVGEEEFASLDDEFDPEFEAEFEGEEASPLSERPDGPFDEAELPEDDATERLDLGGIRLSVPPGVEVRLDLDQQQQVVAATLVSGEELMQLGAFAAPRSEGIWNDVRAEIQESIVSTGGSVTVLDGPFGPELQARIPTDQPGVFAPARFVGINGPRWFIRALFSGPVTAEGGEDPLLAAALRAVVVVRGGDAMAPRDGLPLRLPHDAQLSAEAAMAAQAEAEPERTLPSLVERGPEITETA